MASQLIIWSKPPRATTAVISVWILAFILLGLIQLSSLGELKPILLAATLDAYGGATPEILTNPHAWYRAFCAPLYHVSWSHLARNCLAFYFCGLFLEPFIKQGWFLLILFSSELAGVLLGCIFLTDQSVSVGGSGGVMGIIAAGIVISFRVQERSLRNEIRAKLIAPLVVTFLPAISLFIRWALGYRLNHDGIDHWAHVGGAIMGSCLGGLVICLWPPFEPHPRYEKGAFLLSLLFCLISAFAVVEALLS